MAQISRSPKMYDVCIVGSGAAGGMAAKTLTEGGLNVVMLEAGPLLDIARHYTEHTWPYDLPHRGAGIGGSGYNASGSREFDVAHIASRIEGEPYINAAGSHFRWGRARILGGRTNHWNCVALRLSEEDFQPRSRHGYGIDWPLTYQDLKPYYDRVESFIGVHGAQDGIPSAPDGVYLPPPKPRCSDLLVRRGCEKLDIPCVAGRAAILTRPHRGRAACHYCAQCNQGCHSASTFSSSQVLIPPALATGRLTIIPYAMARKVLVGREGKATGVSYVDKQTRREQRVRARAVVVGASACESARLLLNSRSSLFPDGLANSSGVVGRYLMDTTATTVVGRFPELAKVPPHNHDGTGSHHVYVPWWKYDRKNDFLGGYHIEVYGGPAMPKPGMFRRLARQTEGYGSSLKQSCREEYGTLVRLLGRGEAIPNEKSYCEIDSETVDKWGIPVLKFHLNWTDNDVRMAKDMHDTFEEIIHAGGGTPFPSATREGFGYLIPGGVAHELGVVRMGKDPKESALNGFCQAHDVKNLFVSDGACFTSNPDKNPTITILALSMRSSEFLLDEARKGNL